jgi:hypothetical protein
MHLLVFSFKIKKSPNGEKKRRCWCFFLCTCWSSLSKLKKARMAKRSAVVGVFGVGFATGHHQQQY